MAYSPIKPMSARDSYEPVPGLLEYCMQKLKDSADAYRDFHESTIELYKLNRCIYTGKDLPYKNKVMLPLTYSATWSGVAMQIQTSLGEYPYLEFEANAPDQQPSARRITSLVNAQAEKIGLVNKMVDFLGSGEVYGTAIGRHHWSYVTSKHKFRQNIMGREYVRTQDVVKKNTPDFDVVDILNFLPQKGVKYIADMSHCGYVYMSDFDTLMRENNDAIKQTGRPIYNEAALARVASKGFANGRVSNLVARPEAAARNFETWDNSLIELYTKPVEIAEFWGCVPPELAVDGYTEICVIIADGETILSADCYPYWHVEKPFFSFCPMPDLHGFYGVGKAEIGKRMAMAANKLVSMRIDAMELFGSPSFFAADGLSLGGQSLALWPGRVVRVNGSVDDSRIKPITPDLRGTSMIFQEVEAIQRYLTQGHGLHEDTMQGIQSGDRTTAREFLGRMEQGRTRIGLESRLFEINALEPLFEIFHKLNRQFLPAPQWVKVIGAAALVDINTGLPIPPEPELLDLSDLNADYQVRAKGATQLLSKSMKRQDLITVLQAISTNPVMMQLTNFQAFSNKLWRTFEFDPAEMTNIQIPAINQMAQEFTPNVADAMSGGGNTMLPGLNTGTLNFQQPGNVSPLGGPYGG